MKWTQILAGYILVTFSVIHAQVPIKEVLAQVDPVTQKAKDTSKEWNVTGVVAARVTLGEDRVVAFVLNPNEPALPVITDVKGAALLAPRNEVTLSGNLGEGPFGAALVLKPGTVSVVATNRPFGLSQPVGGEMFKDGSALAARYVQLTNVTVVSEKFGVGGLAKAKCSDGREVTLVVGKGVNGHASPGEKVNAFGILVRVGDEWRLAAARFLLVRARDAQNIATKRTCFTCHNPDTKLIGPAYRDVAARYRQDPDAVAKLTSQMEKGGSGKWGTVPMPALAAVVPAEERQFLAEWIMSYRWDALLAD